jgi:transcriptional regulator of arginine metabolism
MSKTARLLEIRKIIQSSKISSQEELLDLLNKRGHGFTQATLSRDLRYLKAIKVPDDERGMIYVLPETQLQPASQNGSIPPVGQPSGFISVEYTSNMAVIKTLPGFASSLAYRIDAIKSFEIIGTIAGDDTLLVIAREGIPRQDLANCLRPFLS